VNFGTSNIISEDLARLILLSCDVITLPKRLIFRYYVGAPSRQAWISSQTDRRKRNLVSESH